MAALNANPDYRVVVTGHSLGGGATGMMALLWHDDPELKSRDIKYYCLAPPLSFSEEFNRYIDKDVTSVINGDDCVPRLSLGAVVDLLKVVEFFEEEEKKGTNHTPRALVEDFIQTKLQVKDADIQDRIQLYHEIKNKAFTSTFTGIPGQEF
jgi:hypothetical protein